jgi:hypothetical protein
MEVSGQLYALADSPPSTRYPLYMGLGGAHNQSGRYEEENLAPAWNRTPAIPAARVEHRKRNSNRNME